MKATDLKIGDIVTYHHEVVTIREIRKDTVQIKFQDGELTMANLNQIEPCKIFEKHLKTNCFYETKENYYVKSIAINNLDDNRRIALDLNINCISVFLESITGFGNLRVFIADINSMHELQHITAIFGVEIHL